MAIGADAESVSEGAYTGEGWVGTLAFLSMQFIEMQRILTFSFNLNTLCAEILHPNFGRITTQLVSYVMMQVEKRV